MTRRRKLKFSDRDFAALAVGERCALCKEDKPAFQIVCDACWENTSEERKTIILKMMRSRSIGVALRRLYCWRFKIGMTTRRLKTVPLFHEAEAA